MYIVHNSTHSITRPFWGQAWVSILFVGVIVPDEKVIKEEKLISKMLWG